MAQLLLRACVLHRMAFGRNRFEGLQAIQIQVLLALGLAGEELRVNQLAEQIALNRTALSQVLWPLATRCLITRRTGCEATPDRADRRERWLMITPDGERLCKRLIDSLTPEWHAEARRET